MKSEEQIREMIQNVDIKLNDYNVPYRHGYKVALREVLSDEEWRCNKK